MLLQGVHQKIKKKSERGKESLQLLKISKCYYLMANKDEGSGISYNEPVTKIQKV